MGVPGWERCSPHEMSLFPLRYMVPSILVNKKLSQSEIYYENLLWLEVFLLYVFMLLVSFRLVHTMLRIILLGQIQTLIIYSALRFIHWLINLHHFAVVGKYLLFFIGARFLWLGCAVNRVKELKWQIFNQEVLRFQVSVDYKTVMDISNPIQHFVDHEK